MLDGLADKRVNIKDLATSEFEGKKVLDFDPRRDITERDWYNIQVELGVLAQEIDTDGHTQEQDNFSIFAINARLLAGLSGKELPITYPKDLYAFYFDHIADVRKDPEEGILSEDFYFLKNLFPERFANIPIEPGDFAQITKAITGNTSNIVYTAVEALSTFPLLAPELNITTKDYDQINGLASAWRRENRYWNLAAGAANTRLLFPDNSLIIEESDWPHFKSKLRSFRQPGASRNFASLARDLTILSAHDARIADQGILIILDHPKLEKANMPIPIRRGF